MSTANRRNRRALIVVDVQRDFMTGGTLAVPLPGEKLPDPEQILPVINRLMAEGNYARIALTQDFHPADHCSFAPNLGVKPFERARTPAGREQVAWPVHCVQRTPGADFHPALHTHHADVIIRKGTDPAFDSYSGFEDDGGAVTGLAGYLRAHGIEDLDLVGIATDVCVRATALDARANGFRARVHLAGCAGTARAAIDAALDEMRSAGVEVIEAEP